MTRKDNKFLFDLHDFEKEAEEEKEKRLNKTPPAPTFSLEDMEEARKDAFEKGKIQGMQMAKDSIEQKTELTIQSLAQSLQLLESEEQSRREDFLNHAVAISHKALKAILPDILDQTREDLMKAALTEFFSDSMTKTEMVLYVHPDMIEPITKYAKTLNPNLKIEGDDSLNIHQARILWDQGAFEFKPDTLMERILQTIKGRIEDRHQILDETGKTPHTMDTEPQNNPSNGEEDGKKHE